MYNSSLYDQNVRTIVGNILLKKFKSELKLYIKQKQLKNIISGKSLKIPAKRKVF